MMHGLTFRTVLGLLVVAVLGTGGYLRWTSIPNPAYEGITMGTDYHIRIAGRIRRSDLRKIASQIDHELTKVNKEMSTWDPA
ncbi:MAG: FAD:protein FMN transferase, partial [Kiritimatiellales bacterium]|nr:FAD:protein FMN transferase [Kiritimatiellales bacterium]